MTYNRKEKVTMSKETINDISTYPIRELADRGISLKTATHYGIRTAVSPTDGVTPVAYYFPYTTEGEVVGYKKKDLTIEKGGRYHFTTIGKVTADTELFGQSVCSGGRKLYITEGEGDCAALYEVLINRVKGTKYEGMTPNVTSIGLGTSNAARHISSNMEFLERFQEVILVFDQDEATPAERKKGILKGWDAVAEVSHLIPEVKVARLSKNDPCDMVKAGKQKELGDAVLFNSERYRPKGILSGTEISLEKLREVRPRGIGLPFPELDKKMRGLRLGELTVLIAPAKSGKSTVVSEIEYHLNKHHEQKVAAIHLEAGYEEAARNQIALDNDVLPDHLAENPYMIPEEDYVKSYNELVANGRYFSVSHWGSLDSEELLDKIRHFAIVEQCKFVILDHISMIFSGMMSRDERQDIDWLLTQMAQMVVELNIHIIAVAHIKRSNNKNFYEGAVPTLSDARGSGAFEQLAFNVVSVARNHMAEDNDRITLHLLANRKARRTGECDTLIYDQNTGRLRVEEQEY